MTPTPRSVPDRPSDAALAKAFWQHHEKFAFLIGGTLNRIIECAHAIDLHARAIDAAAPPAEAPGERGEEFPQDVAEALDALETMEGDIDGHTDCTATVIRYIRSLAAAPAAPAEGVRSDALEMAEEDAALEGEEAPRVTGGREAQDAARYTWLRCGGWEVMQDPAMWPEALRFDGAIDAAMALVALQAANGGEG